MRVVDETRFAELIQNGGIIHRHCQYLDGIKIGLRIDPVGHVLPAVVDLGDKGSSLEPFDVRTEAMVPGRLYLLRTEEAIALPPTIFGFMHTRSRFARLGLDFLGSSNYVAPAYGDGAPANLVLEVTCKAQTRNLPLDTAVAALVLFEVETPIRAHSATNRFPFDGVSD